MTRQDDSRERRAAKRAEPAGGGNVVRIVPKAPQGKLPLRVPAKLRRHRGPPGSLCGDDSAFATL